MNFHHIVICMFLLFFPVWSFNSNVSISLSSPDSSKPLLYTQLNTEETVVLSQQTDGSYLFTKFDSSGNFVQSTKNYVGTRSFQQLQGLKNGNFAYIWQEDYGSVHNLSVQVYDNNITEIGSAFVYKSFSQCCSDTRIVKNKDGGFSVFYYDIYSGHWRIFMQSFNGTGANTLSEVLLSITGDSVTPGPVVSLGVNDITLLFYQDISQTQITLLNSTTGIIIQAPVHLYSTGSNPNIAKNSSSCQMKSGKIFLVAKKNYTGTVTDGFYTIMYADATPIIDRKRVSNQTFGIYTPRCSCLQNGNAIVAWGLANASNSGYFSYFYTVIDPDGVILNETYAFDTYGGSDDFMIESFADSRFFIAAKDTMALNIQYYNSSVSNSQQNQNIIGCLIYSVSGNCSQCNSSTIQTLNALNCSNPIDNCQSYFDNNTCAQCTNNKIASTDKTKCIIQIVDCMEYCADETCCRCNNSKVPSSLNKTCVSPIDSCSNYSDNGSCLACSNSNQLTNDQTACVNPISDCTSITAQATCLQCLNGKVPSSSEKTCVSPITSCSNYSDNGSCLACSNSKQLTNDQTACVNPISDCASVTVQAICLQCSNGKIQSYNKTACVLSISSCLQETDDSKCLSCLFGTPSTNQTVCQANSSSTQAIQAKIATDTSSNSAQNTNFLSKDQNTTIELVNNLNTNYTMGLDKPYISLKTATTTIQVSATSKPSRKTTNGASITASLSSLSTGNYKIQIDIGFTKSKKRLLADATQDDNLPDYFTVSYDPPVNFFVGSDKEIESEYTKITQSSSYPYNLSVGEIIGIVFSIFGFLTLAAIAFWLCDRWGRKRDKKGYNAPPDQIITSPIETEKN